MKKSNFPCNTTRFFFDKVEGKQFHPKYSGCDDFTVRLQIKKHKDFTWEEVAYRLRDCRWLEVFKTPGMCSTNGTKLVATFREKKYGDHTKCLQASSSFRKAYKRAKKLKLKNVVHDWPINCKLRKK